MKTTMELPDSLFRRVKATAARRGQTMAAFVASALEAKLATEERASREKPWMEFAGILKDDKDESKRILQRVEEACEVVNPG